LRRRAWIFGITTAAFCLALTFALLKRPVYEAQATIEMLTQDSSGLEASSAPPPQALDFAVTQQTALGVLQSDNLALRVIDEMNPEKKTGKVSTAVDNETGDSSKASDQLNTPHSPEARALTDASSTPQNIPTNSADCGLLDRMFTSSSRPCLVARFQSRLKVKSVPGTRLITVVFSDTDPKRASEVVNRLVSNFIDYSFHVRYDATKQQTDWLTHQLVDLKTQVEAAQQKAIQLQKESGIFGADEQHNIVLTRLEQLNDEVTSAESDRVAKETIYRMAKDGSPELIVGMLGGPVGSGSAQNSNSASLLNSLRQQESEADAQYADLSAKYGPAYPRLVQLKERRAAIRATIATEIEKVQKRAKNEFQLSAARESAAKKNFTEQKAVAAQMNDSSVNYLVAKHEAESSQATYEQLLRKLKEANVLSGLRANEYHVVDTAQIPEHPKPILPFYLGFGTLGGLLLGIVSAIMADSLDHTVTEVEELERSAFAPVIGLVPLSRTSARKPHLLGSNGNSLDLEQGTAQAVLAEPAIREAFRTIRTNLLLSCREEPVQVVLVTSGVQGEGKSFTSLNLAVTLARSGRGDVLLVDADLRCRSLSKWLGMETGPGLIDLLARNVDAPTNYKTLQSIPNLHILPAGNCDEFDSEQLTFERISSLTDQWREKFCFVILDSPPVLPVSDGLVMSQTADSIILVARASTTDLQSVARAVRALRDVQSPRIGVVLNGLDASSPEYIRYSGYKAYGEYQQKSSGYGT
jgi:capsular exopolysaccharide synthesis family protein